MLRDQRFDRGRLQPVVLFMVVRNFRKPFPPEHPGQKRMTGWQTERDFDAALLDFGGVFAAGLESPRFRGGECALVVTDLNKEKLFAGLLREFLQLGAALFPSR